MKVYVVETGCYSERGVAGVYDCPERAMAVFGGNWRHSLETYTTKDGSTWEIESWSNDLDWGEHATIHAEEVVTTGPLSSDGKVEPPEEAQGMSFADLAHSTCGCGTLLSDDLSKHREDCPYRRGELIHIRQLPNLCHGGGGGGREPESGPI